jgi:phosphoribosyl 1,2-cyclic phosphodiesterase
LGSITPHVVDKFRGCHSLLLEFNHDLPLLLDGPYPPHLKRRVGGDWGHLSNQQAAEFLHQIDSASLRHLVVAHISEKNNRLDLTEDALLSVFDTLERVIFAEQASGFDWLDIAGAT